MTATDIHCCHANAAELDLRAPCASTTGAKAMSGTVWLRTIHGSRPHSARRQRCITSAEHDADDDADEPADRRDAERDERGAAATATHSGGVSPPLVGSNSRATMSQTCGIARSCVRGRSMTPEPVSPSIGADDDAVGRAEELVELPEHGEHRERRPSDARTRDRDAAPRLRAASRASARHALAVTCSESAGMTVSP